jgi:hypothetical protein
MPSEHPSRPSFEDARAYTMELMQQGQLDHRTARSAVRSYDRVTFCFHLLNRHCFAPITAA